MIPPVTLDPATRRQLRTLAGRSRAAAEKAETAQAALRAALIEAKTSATVRELAEATGLSFQRVHQIVSSTK